MLMILQKIGKCSGLCVSRKFSECGLETMALAFECQSGGVSLVNLFELTAQKVIIAKT
jgi:hypothetical protein